MVHHKGFTLIEALVALAVASVIVSLASPSFFETIRNNKLRSSADNIYSLIRYARAEAVRQGKTINVGAFDGLSWSTGAVVWSEIDNVAGFDSDKDIEIRRADVSDKVIVSEVSDLKVIRFNGEGYATASVDLSFCDMRSNEVGRRIDILESGFSAIANKDDC